MSTQRTHLSVFSSPERYVQGRDATEALGVQLNAVGINKGTVLVVATATPRRLLEDTWRRVLPAAGYEPLILDFKGDCTARAVAAIEDEAKRRNVAAVVAAGGGQVIDAGRAAADQASVPFVSCPTVASTDAPCSALSVLYTEDGGAVDRYVFQKRHPVLVLVDTSAVARAPRHLLVGGLGDALATYYEARTTYESGEKGRTLCGARPSMTALAMARLCRDTLFEHAPAALASCDVGAVTPALERIVEANTLLSGLGFEGGGICVAHACHNGLTTCASCVRGHSHGERVAFGLHVQLALEGRTQELEEVHAFCERVGLPLTLADVSVDAGDDDLIAQIAARTVAPGESAHNEPFAVDAAMVADAIRAADRMGTRFAERQLRA